MTAHRVVSEAGVVVTHYDPRTEQVYVGLYEGVAAAVFPTAQYAQKVADRANVQHAGWMGRFRPEPWGTATPTGRDHG
jgi:hypothetical protein